MRLMLMPFLSASSETEPVTEVSSCTSPPIAGAEADRQAEVRDADVLDAGLGAAIRLSGPFCRSGSVAT